MSNIPHVGMIAVFDETTPFTPPANAAAWQSQARFKFILDSLDVSGIKPAVVPDERSQTNPFGRDLNLKGLRGGELPVSIPATGTGVTTASGTQVAETVYARLLENHLGGMHRTNSTVLSGGGHTTTSIQVTSEANFAEGACIGWQSPTTGITHCRRLVTNTSGTIWTLDEALPETPLDADVIHGGITYFLDPEIMAQSNASGRQLSYLIQLGLATIDELETWVLIGCVNTIKSIKLNRGAPPSIDLSILYASHVLPSESPPTGMSWAAEPIDFAPSVVGPEGLVFFQDVATTTRQQYCTSDLVINPGFPRTAVETITEVDNNAQGVCHYSANFKTDAEVGFTLTPFATDEFADWANGTLKQFRYQTGTLPGGIFAFGVSQGEVREAPGRAVQNDATSRRVMLRPGFYGSIAPFTTATDLTRTPYYIAQL